MIADDDQLDDDDDAQCDGILNVLVQDIYLPTLSSLMTHNTLYCQL